MNAARRAQLVVSNAPLYFRALQQAYGRPAAIAVYTRRIDIPHQLDECIADVAETAD
jgi:hypothetical protein